MSHDQPTYASVPGIRVYGMMCVQGTRRGRPLRNIRSVLGENFFHHSSKKKRRKKNRARVRYSAEIRVGNSFKLRF